MSFLRLGVTHFRNLKLTLNTLSPKFNFFYGNNGSGKTSLLEAIYYLNRGRSFRSTYTKSIINHSADEFSLFAEATTNMAITLGLTKNRSGNIKIKINGKEQSLSELIRLIPTVLIHSNCHYLLEGGPMFRRKYLNWGAYYFFDAFFRVWKRYEHALKQRNAALRNRVSQQELAVWTNELILSGQSLDQLRQEWVAVLQPCLMQLLKILLEVPDLLISYWPGWEGNYPEAVMRTLNQDRELGHTQYGPHRADLKITIKQKPAKDILSRGQQKLFVCAMILAQGNLVQTRLNKGPIYLIDDLPSELDDESKFNLMTLLSKQKAQIFLTACEREALMHLLIQFPSAMFHVEHGNISECFT